MNPYLTTDERIESIKSLEKTIQFLKETDEDIYQWKWFLISLHNCLQAFMVLALKSSNSFNVMRPKHVNKWLDAYENDRDYPEVKLDFFNELFLKIQTDSMNIYSHSEIFTSNEEINESVKKLNNFRNNFIHFMPMSWSLEISGLSKLGLDIHSVLNFLVFESGNVYFYEEGQMRKVQEMLENLKEELVLRGNGK